MTTLPMAIRRKIAISTLRFAPSILLSTVAGSWLEYLAGFDPTGLSRTILGLIVITSVFGIIPKRLKCCAEELRIFGCSAALNSYYAVPAVFDSPLEQAVFRITLYGFSLYGLYILGDIAFSLAGRPWCSAQATYKPVNRVHCSDSKADWRDFVTGARPYLNAEVDVWLITVPLIDEQLLYTLINYFRDTHQTVLSLADASTFLVKLPSLLAAGVSAAVAQEITAGFAPFGVGMTFVPAGSAEPPLAPVMP